MTQWYILEETRALSVTMDEVHHSILTKSSGVTHTFVGYDRVIHDAQERQGHKVAFQRQNLAIKVGYPMMLPRNLYPSQMEQGH